MIISPEHRTISPSPALALGYQRVFLELDSHGNEQKTIIQ
jgi:hypothetical protein